MHKDANAYNRRLLWLILAVGFLLQMLALWRSWIRGDQLVLLRIGWDFVQTGQLEPFAKQMSGGGFVPGTLLQLLIGVSLFLFNYYKSTYILVSLLHLPAFMLVYNVVKNARGSRYALIFTAVYWLSPWRLFHSSFIWEPSLVFLPIAACFWGFWKSRNRAAILPSAVIGLSLMSLLQIHGSFLIPWLATIIMLIRRRIRLSIPGILLGLVAGAIPMIPAILEISRSGFSSILPQRSDRFLFYGLLRVHPLVKGFLYWFRISSIDIGTRLHNTIFMDFTWNGNSLLAYPVSIIAYLATALSYGSVALPMIASRWYFLSKAYLRSRREQQLWLWEYSFSFLLAVVIASAVSPVTMQGWYILIALIPACIPVTEWIDSKLEQCGSLMRTVIYLFIIIRIPVTLLFIFGQDKFLKQPFVEEEHIEIIQEIRPILPYDIEVIPDSTVQ